MVSNLSLRGVWGPPPRKCRNMKCSRSDSRHILVLLRVTLCSEPNIFLYNWLKHYIFHSEVGGSGPPWPPPPLDPPLLLVGRSWMSLEWHSSKHFRPIRFKESHFDTFHPNRSNTCTSPRSSMEYAFVSFYGGTLFFQSTIFCSWKIGVQFVFLKKSNPPWIPLMTIIMWCDFQLILQIHIYVYVTI